MRPDQIREAVRRLQAAQPAVFGASGHRFALNPPVSAAEVVTFERVHRVELPAAYREFITAVGNGGAGPYYGVFPLGQMDGTGAELQPWQSQNGIVGILSEPFLLREVWNDLTGMPADSLADTDACEYERQLDAFDQKYWDASRLNGSFPICHMGCALRLWLVVTGDEAGHMWCDRRAEYAGLVPVRAKDGSPATFSSWYAEWLDDALAAML